MSWLLAAAPSRVPFYAAGGVLAGWAVLVAVTGITHPDFPTSRLQGRLVMLTSIVLVAATLTAAVATSSRPGEAGHEAQAAPAAAATLALAAPASGEPAYDRTRLSAHPGRVTIRFSNPSPAPHNVTVAAGGRTVAATKTITGASASVSATLKPGTYEYFCSVDAHRQLGMRGTLTVR